MKELKKMNLFELVNQVAITGGMNTDIDSICIMQDIIGHSTIEEVAAVANSERKEAFYRVYGVCYGTVEAIKYYLNNSEALAEKIESQKQDVADEYEKLMKDQSDRYKKATEEAWNERNIALTESSKKQAELNAARTTIEEQKNEIIKLKAMLFDYMNK